MLQIQDNNYDKNLFIFGSPVETPFGIVRPLTYLEFLMNQNDIGLISQNTLHIYYSYRNQIKTMDIDEKIEAELKRLKETDLMEIVFSTPQLLGAYLKIYQLIFDKNEETDYQALFTEKEIFHFIRKLVMDMNVVTEDKVSHNEEIQKGIERSRRVKALDNPEKTTFVDIVTSIAASTNHSFEQIEQLNVFQVYALYARVGAIFNYQTTTLFATVAEKVNIESWNKHIDLFKSEDDTISKEEFDKKFGGLLKM